MSTKKFQNLSKYSLSEVHSNTGRFLFEFNCLQYTLAAPEVFVAFANPVSLPSGYRVSIVRNTNVDRSKPHPYGIVDTVEHAYSIAAELALGPLITNRQAGCVCYYLQTVDTYGSEGGSTWCLGDMDLHGA